MLQDLLHLFSTLPGWLLPVLGGTISALLAFYLLQSLLANRQGKPEAESADHDEAPGLKTRSLSSARNQDRRNAMRRSGNSVAVYISDAEAQKEPWQGWVIDRSAGGLCITTEMVVPAGTVLSVRSSNASSGIPWVQVEVKNCRFVGKEYELGCQFVKTPPWSVLLMFG